jgi:hypothetical protein
MIRLLADNDAEGHVGILVRVLMSETWIAFWNDLGLAVVLFEDLGLHRDARDAEVWRTCQREQVVLITNNRNADDPDSLERTIREENRSDSLPVFTLANPEQIRVDRAYAERTALRLLEYLTYLDDARGAGRLFLP